MMSPKYISALALLAAMTTGAEAGALASGVCYSPWHHGSVNEEVLQKDYKQIKEHFASIRTYHARFGNVNAIDSAAKAGLRVSVGIMMKDRGDIDKEIDAACEGAKRNPASVDAIYVGNENLQNGGFGSFSAAELVGYISKVKGCTAGTNIKVGSVQRINEWLSAPGSGELAAACDSIGVNIYPFFTPGDKKPIDKFKDQWKQINDKYAGGKVHVTETGWPRAGSASSGNTPCKETTQSFFNEYSEWAQTNPMSYYFMMYDTKEAYGGGDYEKFFGVADTNGKLQITIPSGSGTPTSGPYTPAPTSAPYTLAPTSGAPNTTAPTSGPYTPAPTSAPNTPAPTSGTPSTTAPTSGPYTQAPSTKAPETPCPSTKSPETKAPETPRVCQ